MAKVAKKKSKGGVAKKAVTKKATPKKAIAKKSTAKKTAKKAAPKKATAKKTAPKKVAAKKAAPKKPPAKKAAPVAKAPAANKTKSGVKKTTLPKRPPAERDVIDEHAPRARSGRHRSDDAHAFLPDPSSTGHRRVKDDFAEGLGEEFVATVTSGESTDDERDATDPEEDGGPFITTSAKNEFGQGTDASNPEDAEVEPFPTTHGGR